MEELKEHWWTCGDLTHTEQDTEGPAGTERGGALKILQWRMQNGEPKWPSDARTTEPTGTLINTEGEERRKGRPVPELKEFKCSGD